MRRILASIVIVAAALGLLSCNRGSGVAAAPPSKPAVHTVVIEGMRFQPDSLTVKTGDTIVWVNKDLFPHTATAQGNFDSQSIDAGKSWELKPAAKGEITYICTFHPTMKAMVRVE